MIRIDGRMNRPGRFDVFGRQRKSIEPETEQVSVLGPEFAVEGEIKSAGTLRILGSVSGEVRGAKVIVGPGGYVEGTIFADAAEIHGHVNGRVFAPTVDILATATVDGQVFHHKLTVAAGAVLRGRMPWRPVGYFEANGPGAKDATA